MPQDTVYYHGQPIKPEELKVVGNGGEGTVYLKENHSPPMALKVLHGWQHLGKSHAEVSKDPVAMIHLKKLGILQDKLKRIPTEMPDRIVKPNGLLFDATRQIIVGTGMPYIEGDTLNLLADSKVVRSKYSMTQMTNILLDVHKVITDSHNVGIVHGDMSSNDFIIERVDRFLRSRPVDFDSMQWGTFKTNAFTWDFADPLLLELQPNGLPDIVRAHNKLSDWYSFTAITMQILTRIGPYDGAILPSAQKQWGHIKDKATPLHRLNIFHKDVGYPRAGTPLDRFPAALVNYWRKTFVDDYRGVFPFQLLMQLKWHDCPKCHTVYASERCPNFRMH